MRKLGLVCVAAFVCIPSVTLAPAADPAPLHDADHWINADPPQLLAELAGQIQSLDPEDSRTLARAGHILLRAGKTDEAAGAFKSALQADPKDDEAFVLIAMAYREKKMWAEADEWFARAVERDPKDLDHQVEWGVSLWDRGDRKKAAEMFVKALKAEPKAGRLLYKIGRGID